MQAFNELNAFLAAKHSSLVGFRAAQLDWENQIGVLYSTPAATHRCQELLQQLQHVAKLLLWHVQQIEVRLVQAAVWPHCQGYGVLILPTAFQVTHKLMTLMVAQYHMQQPLQAQVECSAGAWLCRHDAGPDPS